MPDDGVLKHPMIEKINPSEIPTATNWINPFIVCVFITKRRDASLLRHGVDSLFECLQDRHDTRC
jgi:hypothetical protein